jgi:hypothetical protein
MPAIPISGKRSLSAKLLTASPHFHEVGNNTSHAVAEVDVVKTSTKDQLLRSGYRREEKEVSSAYSTRAQAQNSSETDEEMQYDCVNLLGKDLTFTAGLRGQVGCPSLRRKIDLIPA